MSSVRPPESHQACPVLALLSRAFYMCMSHFSDCKIPEGKHFVWFPPVADLEIKIQVQVTRDINASGEWGMVQRRESGGHGYIIEPAATRQL